jgi:hypothetical protein
MRGVKRPWTMEEDELLRQLAAEGLNRHAIAVRLGRADLTVGARAEAIQIPLKVRHQRAKLRGKAMELRPSV